MGACTAPIGQRPERSIPVTRFRPFRNSDPPALVKLWNRTVPEPGAARPLSVYELDTHALGLAYFEAAGLIVAERDGQIVGFVHAGFGPELPVESSQPFQLSRDMGTVAMLVVDPMESDSELAGGLIRAAEQYLQTRGARVVYAGGLFPLNPFYWGLYGGSEGSGILAGQVGFQRSLVELGYEPVNSTVFLQADLAIAEPRDPRAAVIRRLTQFEVQDDPLPRHWWEGSALSEFHLATIRLLSKSDNTTELAHASTWDMNWFGRSDGRTRMGLIDLEVPAEHRRKGYGRFLVSEIFRRARANLIDLVEVQTAATNQPALALYASLGFRPIDQATLYRRPGESVRGP
jgi:ribosomal protein S18 acetylase RimI-like enzyme